MRKALSMIILSIIFGMGVSQTFFFPTIDSANQLEKPSLLNQDSSDLLKEDGKMPNVASDYDIGAKYVWWNYEWTFRIPIQINSSYFQREDSTITIPFLNFTNFLENLDDPQDGALDVDSIRAVEYKADGTMVINAPEYSDDTKYLLPSLFIPTQIYFDEAFNATGQLKVELKGQTAANENRTIMIYFDLLENGPKLEDYLNIRWSVDYNARSDIIGMGNFNLAYGSQYDYPAVSGNLLNLGSLRIWDNELDDYIFNPSTVGSITQYYTMATGDFDGDGDAELLVGDIFRYFAVLEYNSLSSQMGSGQWDSSYEFQTLDNSANNKHYNMLAYDLNADGKDEIITTDDTNEQIVIYGFTSERDLIIYDTLSTPNCQGRHLALADLNQDGWMDIITASFSGPDTAQGNAYYFVWDPQNTQYITGSISSNLLLPPESQILPAKTYSIRVGDIDFDGNMEVLFSGFGVDWAYIYIWEWDGNMLDYESQFNPNMGFPTSGLLGDISDWDNDGRIELVIGNYENSLSTSLRVYEVIGNGQISSTPEWSNDVMPFSRMAYPKFGDPDNDGIMEIVVGNNEAVDVSNQHTADGQVTMWDSNSPIVYDWVSPYEGRNVGSYAYYSDSMLLILGAKDSRIAPAEPEIWVYNAEIKPPELDVRIFDIDMGPVQDIVVDLDNGTGYPSELITDTNGLVTFYNLEFTPTAYTLTISIETGLGTEILYSSPVEMNKTRELLEIFTELWQIDFEISDLDGNAFNMGNVSVFNGAWDTYPRQNIVLDSFGNAKFIWFNRTSGLNEYNYTVLYENPNFETAYRVTPLLNGTVQQSDVTSDYVNFNSTSGIPNGDIIHYTSTFYADGTSAGYIGVQSINWFNLTLTDIEDHIDRVEIMGLEEGGAFHLISNNISPFSSGNVQDWQNSDYLWNFSVPLYALKIDLWLNESGSSNNGFLNITIHEKTVANITVDLTRQTISLIDKNDIPIEDAFIHILNNNQTSQEIVTLLSSENGVNTYFWYLPKDGQMLDGNYSLKITFYGIEQEFKNNSLPLSDYATSLNFTMTRYSIQVYRVNIDITKFYSKLAIYNIDFQDQIDFDENLRIQVNVTAFNDELGLFKYTNADTIGITIENFEGIVMYTNTSARYWGTGKYEFTINPQLNNISLIDGTYQRNFTLRISASVTGYGIQPQQVVKNITINPLESQFEFSSNSIIIPSWDGISAVKPTLDIYYGNATNLTIKFQNNFGQSLSEATVTYFSQWGLSIKPALVDGSDYRVLINATEIGNIGTYFIQFSASKINYTTLTNVQLFVK